MRTDGRWITTWFPILVVMFVSVFVFFPALRHEDYHFPGDHKIMVSMDSQRHLNIVSIAIGTAIPMLIEIMMDYKDFPLHVLIPRFFIVAGILVPNAVFLFSNRTTTLYLNVFQSRSTLIGGGLLITLFVSGNSFPHKVTVVVTTLSCAAFMITSSLALDSSTVGVFPYVLYSLCLAEAVLISIWYGRKVFKDWANLIKSTPRKTTLIHALLISIYACLPMIVLFAFGNKGWGKKSANELIVYVAIDISVAVIAITVPSRLVRQENYRIQVSSLFSLCLCLSHPSRLSIL
jgi:hypothetical protein